MGRTADLPAPIVIAASYAIGSIPFSGIVARFVKGVDLREVGAGTVSGSGLFEVAGLGPLLVGGVLDLAKGAVGPLIAGPNRPMLQLGAGAAGVVGHNWSMFLNGAGGRGISPAMGAMLVEAPEGSAVMLAGLAVGKAGNATSLGAFASFVALVPLLSHTRGRRGRLAALSLVVPLLLKRLAGNRAPEKPRRARVYLSRLLFDQDTPPWPRSSPSDAVAGAAP
jgi:glycerol-3-phosphate acyltransferase PlsY